MGRRRTKMIHAESLGDLLAVEEWHHETKHTTPVFWRIQDARSSMPITSGSAWEEAYPEGRVSFFANLINALEDLSGETGDVGVNYSEAVQEKGGRPVLVGAVSHYETEDAPYNEILLVDPMEVARFSVTKDQARAWTKELIG